MKEPLLISFARFRVAWAELWMQVAVELTKWGEPYREEAQNIVASWEGEWPDEG